MVTVDPVLRSSIGQIRRSFYVIIPLEIFFYYSVQFFTLEEISFSRTNYFTESEYYRLLRYSADPEYRTDNWYSPNRPAMPLCVPVNVMLAKL